MRIAVLGAGSWGTTFAALVSKRNETLLWAHEPAVAAEINEHHLNSVFLQGFELPDALRATSDPERAVAGADVLVMAVPTQWFRTVLATAAPYVRPWIPVVSLAKGLEPGTGLRMSQVVEELLPGHPAAVLSGPNLAREIMGGNAAAAVIATHDHGVATELQALFRRGLFRVYTHHDVVGCEVAGALKNVVAIAAGIADGLGAGDNTRAMVISRGLAELTRLGVAMGGEPATFAGLAGVGDLIATCISPQSRNRHVGEQLGRGRGLQEILGEMSAVAEGVKTAELVLELAERYGVPVPISHQVHQVMIGALTPLRAYWGLMYSPGSEAEPG